MWPMACRMLQLIHGKQYSQHLKKDKIAFRNTETKLRLTEDSRLKDREIEMISKKKRIKATVIKPSNGLIGNVKITLILFLKNMSHQKMNIMILLLMISEKQVPKLSINSQKTIEQIEVPQEVILSETFNLNDIVTSEMQSENSYIYILVITTWFPFASDKRKLF